MANFSTYGKSFVAKTVFTAEAVTRPTAWYIGVGTGHTSSGLTGEPSGNGYSRQQVVFTESGGVATLDGAESFGPCSGTTWGTIASAAIFDAATAGNCLAVGALTASRVIEVGDSLTVASAALTFTVS